jgi:DNA invertase Pin-like site-specific DNA recombinase
MRHLITLVDDLRGRGIGFRSLNEGAIDTTSASGELIFNVFSALAQFERRLIQERTKAGLVAARARGRRGGRPRIEAEEAKVRAAKKLAVDNSIPIDDTHARLKYSSRLQQRFNAAHHYRMSASVTCVKGLDRPAAPCLSSAPPASALW